MTSESDDRFPDLSDSAPSAPTAPEPQPPRYVPEGFEGIERNESVDLGGIHGLGGVQSLEGLQGFGTAEPVEPTEVAEPAGLAGLQGNDAFDFTTPPPAADPEPEPLDLIDLDALDIPEAPAAPAAPVSPPVRPAAVAAPPVAAPTQPAPVEAEPPVAAEPEPPPPPPVPRVLCPRCGKPRGDTFFEVDGEVVCTACRNRVKATQTRLNSWRADGKPLLFGLAAGVLGAIVYGVAVAFIPIDIALVAPLCGYLVAKGVRRGAGGGSRQLQVLAAVLTWYAVGLGYAPVTGRHRLEHVALKKARADSVASVERAMDSVRIAEQLGTDSAVDMVAAKAQFVRRTGPLISADSAMKRYRASPVNALGALAVVMASAVWYPVMALIAARWLGIVGAAFIAVAMWLAWRQLEGREPVITGPHRD